MGALDGNKNVTYVNNGAHVDANSGLIGPDGALVIEDDFGHRAAAPDTSGHTFIHHDLQVANLRFGAHASPRPGCTRPHPTLPVWQVNADDAANFFVIGLVRRPCDYQLSVWASGSRNNYHKNPALAKAQGWWGASPPCAAATALEAKLASRARSADTPRHMRRQPPPHLHAPSAPKCRIAHPWAQVRQRRGPREV